MANVRAGQGLTRKRFASGWSGDPISVFGARFERDGERWTEKGVYAVGTQLSDGSN